MSGYNPLRYDCAKKGECFLKKHHPPIESLAKYLPGNITMGDIDGCVEINGAELRLEVKGPGVDYIPAGQELMFKRRSLEQYRHTTVVVWLDCRYETFEELTRIVVFKNGDRKEIDNPSEEVLGRIISEWVNEAKSFKTDTDIEAALRAIKNWMLKVDGPGIDEAMIDKRFAILRSTWPIMFPD